MQQCRVVSGIKSPPPNPGTPASPLPFFQAPNTVVDELCPANKANRAKYNVPPGQLTENGMNQALKLGNFLRGTYIESMDFLPPTLGSGCTPTFSSWLKSDSAARCLQTAQAMAMGLFPYGTGPPGFPNQPMAVLTEPNRFASLLAAPHGPCLAQQKADNAAYDSTRGEELIQQSRNITDVVSQACGVPTEAYTNVDNGKEGLVLGVKDVSDMLDFDEQQGLPRLASVSKQAHEDMTQLAFTLLQERYYSNRRQITYWAGDFPPTLLDHFNSAATKHDNGQRPDHLYLGYHGHRELLYGVAHFLGWHFDVEGAPTALGTSSIPPATTMVFELHYRAHEQADNGTTGAEQVQDEASAQEEAGYYYVRTYTWTPEFGQREVVLDACSGVEAGTGCRLTTIEAIVSDSVQDTGSWQEICNDVPFDQAEQMAQHVSFSDDFADDTAATEATADSGGNIVRTMVSTTFLVVALALVGGVFWFGVVALKVKWRRAGERGAGAYEAVG
ncbi:unnamed protein product [Ectocarpus sp. 6 AP-2014]